MEELILELKERIIDVLNLEELTPEDIDAEGIKATFTNGLLRLEVPKKEKVMPKTIKIN